MAIIQNITIDQDCDFTETLTVKDSTGTVVDLSNETITSTMRKTYSSATAYSFTTAKVSATDGTCTCLLYTSPSPRDNGRSRMPSSA